MGWIEFVVTAIIAGICTYAVLCFSWPEIIFIKTSQCRKKLPDEASRNKDSGRIAV